MVLFLVYLFGIKTRLFIIYILNALFLSMNILHDILFITLVTICDIAAKHASIQLGCVFYRYFCFYLSFIMLQLDFKCYLCGFIHYFP